MKWKPFKNLKLFTLIFFFYILVYKSMAHGVFTEHLQIYMGCFYGEELFPGVIMVMWDYIHEQHGGNGCLHLWDSYVTYDMGFLCWKRNTLGMIIAMEYQLLTWSTSMMMNFPVQLLGAYIQEWRKCPQIPLSWK